MVKPATIPKISKDEADNRIYECAEAAGADYIVTGNIRHFPEDREPQKLSVHVK